MAYRNIIISNPAKISIKNEQLVVKTDNEYYVPIEDISSILLESLQIVITSFALAKLSDNGVAVFICNEKHLPCAVFTPCNCHSRQLKIINNQYNQTKPFMKRLWQQIIMQKIKNQALCMKICGYVQAESLYKLAEIVQSGDKTNVEGRAAAMYFKILFGRNFTRSFNNVTNACLNYGYAILRGIIAKNLAIYGFEPCIGIFHHSELNNFNLADDLIESYRPVIDLFVAQNVNEDCVSFDTTTKYSIFNLLNTSINIDEQQHSVFYAIEKTVQSLSACFLYKKEELVLPTLIPLKIHEYE